MVKVSCGLPRESVTGLIVRSSSSSCLVDVSPSTTPEHFTHVLRPSPLGQGGDGPQGCTCSGVSLATDRGGPPWRPLSFVTLARAGVIRKAGAKYQRVEAGFGDDVALTP